jgi:hypothetical protein
MFKAVTGASAEECYRFADAMLKARNPEPEEGIVAIKKTRKAKE